MNAFEESMTRTDKKQNTGTRALWTGVYNYDVNDTDSVEFVGNQIVI